MSDKTHWYELSLKCGTEIVTIRSTVRLDLCSTMSDRGITYLSLVVSGRAIEVHRREYDEPAGEGEASA